jgi:small GTP-binding protein
MSLWEKIKAIEEEIRNTEKNKATEKHLAQLKAKLAKLRREVISGKKGGSSVESIRKSGDARVVLIGFPSVGKSSLVNKLTGVKTKSAYYAFTTLSPIPGTLHYQGAKIQILDLPGIIEGASMGKGKGKEVIAIARSADLILFLLNPFDPHTELEVLKKELYNMGIRLDREKPNIRIEKKVSGGINVVSTVKVNEDEIKAVLNEYRIFNADVIINEYRGVEDLIDVIEGNRVYIPSLVAVAKADIHIPKNIPKQWIPVSSFTGYNIEVLKQHIYQRLNLIRIYTKKGNNVDPEPLMLKKGAKVRDVCLAVHRQLLEKFKFARVWGNSVKYGGQRVGLDHVLCDNDTVEIVARV